MWNGYILLLHLCACLNFQISFGYRLLRLRRNWGLQKNIVWFKIKKSPVNCLRVICTFGGVHNHREGENTGCVNSTWTFVNFKNACTLIWIQYGIAATTRFETLYDLVINSKFAEISKLFIWILLYTVLSTFFLTKIQFQVYDFFFKNNIFNL